MCPLPDGSNEAGGGQGHPATEIRGSYTETPVTSRCTPLLAPWQRVTSYNSLRHCGVSKPFIGYGISHNEPAEASPGRRLPEGPAR
jgi:hypothetical protein